jgi:small-conductance mechanosensitive channel
MTKEELERRKEEAQAFMDLSYWKHFVSKQEHILSDVNAQVLENLKGSEECTREVEDTKKALFEIDKEIVDLETREKAVADMVGKAMTQLLSTREELHLVRGEEQAAEC